MDIATILSILKQSPYFTKQNLSLALQKEGEDLNYWINKLLREKALVPLKKGFYVSSYYKDLVAQNPTEAGTYLEYLANILRFPSYISLEYVLSKYSLIPEASFAITSITTKSPRIYSSEFATFLYRSIKPSLFFGFQMKAFRDKKIKTASLAKALFDFFYFKKFSSAKEMRDYFLNEGRINWDVFSQKDKEEFRYFGKVSQSSKMKLIVSVLKKEKLL